MATEELIWSQIERGFESNRLAHAWLIVGDPRENARRMALRMATLVLGEGGDEERKNRVQQLVHEEHHPDLITQEPQSKSRRITTEEIRDLNNRIHETSYEGGWKVALLYHADRLMANAANAFLKTLEEPPDQTLILLLTDSPQAMINTITSRCQRIILSEKLADQSDPVWYARMDKLLLEGWPRTMADSMKLAAGIQAVLDEEEKRVEKLESDKSGDEVDKDAMAARISSRLRLLRTDILNYLQDWYRDVMVCAGGCSPDHWRHPDRTEWIQQEAARLELRGAEVCLERIWDMQRMMERNVPPYNAALSSLRPTRASAE